MLKVNISGKIHPLQRGDKQKLFWLVLLLFCTHYKPCIAQVWQWSVPVEGVISEETKSSPVAFLWIPENCRQVRGVVFTQHNMVEEGMLEHPAFRKTMSELGFAEIWVTPALAITFDFHQNAPADFNRMMKSLAEVSGYKELEHAPIVPMGHSALASFPWNFAAWNPSRTLALISVHGDAPLTKLTGSGRPNPDWGDRNIDGVPSLFVMGEYEWWEERIKPGFEFVKKHPAAPITFFADAGHGHFDYSEEMIRYVCLFIEKAAEKRLPKRNPRTGPVRLLAVLPSKGWLVDRWRKDSLPLAMADRYKNYQGDRYMASWCFDKEMAEATELFYAKTRSKRQQFAGFRQDGKVLDSGKSHARYNLKFNPADDGITFSVSAFYADSSGTKPAIRHSGTPLAISRICGPVRKVNDTTFQISFYRMGFNNPKRSNDIWLLASSKGDDKFKSVVQQANMRFPLVNTEGETQNINFDSIPDYSYNPGFIKLHAVSSVGVPVSFYVKEGPAEVRGNELHVTKIPPKTRFPVKVTIVAWQYGRTAIPKLQSARPITKTFYIKKP